MKFLIVEACFYQHIADLLRKGASEFLTKKGHDYDIVQVPGALEIPAAIAIKNADGNNHYHGYVALGTVIRGETSHYDIVAGQSAAALQQLAIQQKLCIGNGILTCDNEAQALHRADQKNKGADAAQAALTLAQLTESSRL
ncbi:MAG: 6,7-dimethyl-8-ribityllumazine synthase [Alphaproteobacteria bacterium]|nr:6,7-dimethyl-8-ribityllumazine synthase [Alphaproteobacteria bacterium]